MHLLTFWPDPESPELIRHCDIMRQRRNECCLQSAREIEQIYPQFRTEQALEYAKDSGVLFKSGIMQALCELGLAEGIYGEEYHRLFGWEPRGIVLHSPEYPPVQEVLATARAAGASWCLPTRPSTRACRCCGSWSKRDGGRHRGGPPPQQPGRPRRVHRPVCAVRLIRTGGTDFHGSNHKHPHPVGTCTTPDDQIARIEALAQKRKE